MDVTPPALTGAVVLVSGDRLILTFDDDLDIGPGRLPLAGAFTVKANRVTVDVQSVVVGAGTDDFILNLPAGAITESQTVTVSYSVPTTGTVIADTDGNDALSFTDRPVVNNSRVEGEGWQTTFGAAAAGEDAGTVTLTVSDGTGVVFQDDVIIELAYGGTATRGRDDDFRASSSVTLPAGDSSVSTTVTIRDDPQVEGDETIVVTATLADDGTAAGTATLTIGDNDRYGFRVAANPVFVAEGRNASVTLTVTVVDQASNPATAQRCVAPFEVYLDLDLSGTAASPADYTATDDLTQVRLAACQVSETVTVRVRAIANEVQEAAAKTVVFTPRVTNAPLDPDPALHEPSTLEIRDATRMPPKALGQIWSAVLTAADLGSGAFGLDGGDGSLTEDDFAFRSTDEYTVETFSIGGGTLTFGVERAFPSGHADQLTLHVGTMSFALADGTVGQAGSYSWTAPGLAWASGDRVYVQLSAVAVAPGAPTGLAATGAGRRIELVWQAPADDGGGAVTGYRIESSADGGNPWAEVVADTGSDATDYRHRGLMPEETRHYRVYAINARHTGTAASNVASATTLVDGRGALLTPTTLIVDEGTSGSYTVELTEAPTGTVRVTIAGALGY